MILNRRAGWRGGELEMIGWKKPNERPARYTMHEAVDAVTSGGGIETQIDSIRGLLASVLENLPPEAAIAALNKLSDRDFIQEQNSER